MDHETYEQVTKQLEVLKRMPEFSQFLRCVHSAYENNNYQFHLSHTTIIDTFSWSTEPHFWHTLSRDVADKAKRFSFYTKDVQEFICTHYSPEKTPEYFI